LIYAKTGGARPCGNRKVVVAQNKHDEMFAEMRLNVLERELKFL
jgi:hypothetical protein